MSIYLIDYENVNESGLEGVKALKSDDQVHIFYSDQIKTIPFERSIELSQSRARIEFIQTRKTAKNYLDFQLTTYLGFLIGKGEKGEVVVVSNDKGFDSVVDFWKGRNVKISRYENIANKSVPPRASKAKKGQGTKKTGAAAKQTTKKTAAAGQTTDKKASDLTESWRKKVRAAVKEDKLSPGNYTAVYKAIAQSNDKLDLNNRLVKAFDSTRGGALYNHVKGIFDEYYSK
ncbi:MAG: hypothetical protein K6B14_11440 [Lachnospiraceae bacterium]|nr:hypothetical protein [Lachnospiraceae bacterium]